MYLGENIRYLRTKKGYSQDFIAEKLGYKSFTTIQKWESGVSEPPVKKLKELSDLLGVDMDDMNNKRLPIEEKDNLPNRKNNLSGWVAIQESKRFSLFLHPSNKTRQGHDSKSPRRHCPTNC